MTCVALKNDEISSAVFAVFDTTLILQNKLLTKFRLHFIGVLHNILLLFVLLMTKFRTTVILLIIACISSSADISGLTHQYCW